MVPPLLARRGGYPMKRLIAAMTDNPFIFGCRETGLVAEMPRFPFVSFATIPLVATHVATQH